MLIQVYFSMSNFDGGYSSVIYDKEERERLTSRKLCTSQQTQRSQSLVGWVKALRNPT
jgi:hypothetical protein